MNGMATIPSGASAAPRPAPGFFGALRGVWLLTWRAQMTWRRLPGRVALLLALPALAFMTTLKPESFARSHANLLVAGLANRLQGKRDRLQADQIKKLHDIVLDEYTKAATSWQEHHGETAEARKQRWGLEMDKCGDMILSRVKNEKVLHDQQLSTFTIVEEQQRHELGVWDRSAPFYHLLVDFYTLIIVPLVCVRACGALIRDEVQADTLGFLLTRPLTRARLLIVKYLSQLAWLEILLLAQTLLLFAVGAARGVPALGVLLPLVLAAQFLAVPAWSALGMLLGLATTRYIAAALVYGVVVEMGIGRIPTNINTLSLMRHIKTLLSHNMTLQGVYDWPSGSVNVAILALLAAPVLFAAASAALFTFLEYHHAAEMQK